MFTSTKKKECSAWFTPVRVAVLGVATLAMLFAPLWPEFVDGRFALEPLRRDTWPPHPSPRGTVDRDLAMRDSRWPPAVPCCAFAIWSWSSAPQHWPVADLRNASSRALRAGITYENFGPAEHERQQSTVRRPKRGGGGRTSRRLQPHRRHGRCPRLHDLLGAYLKSGTEVAEVANCPP